MRLTILCFIILTIACSGNQKIINPSPYFDTKTFFEDQIKILGLQHISIEKEMIFDDKKQLRKIDPVNWKQELSPFVMVDLLKPSYRGRFSKDSMNIDANSYLITYSCDDKKTDLKKAELIFDLKTQKVKSVLFLMNENNTIYESEKRLTFYTDSAFSIEGKQKIKFTAGLKYRVSAKFLKN